MILNTLKCATLDPPRFVTEGLQYLTKHGSQAFGTATAESDTDLYGFCIPPQESLWPSLTGEIDGYDPPANRFQQFLGKSDAGTGYDVTVYSIARYFYLLAQNNPNVIETLFTPDDCVQHLTHIGRLVRDNRKLFLSQELFPRFYGYAMDQAEKLGNEDYKKGSKRYPLLQQFGYDTKNASHSLRLVFEGYQLLTGSEIRMRENTKILIEVRQGKYSLKEVKELFHSHRDAMKRASSETHLPEVTNRHAVRGLLMDCLRLFYGTLPEFARG